MRSESQSEKTDHVLTCVAGTTTSSHFQKRILFDADYEGIKSFKIVRWNLGMIDLSVLFGLRDRLSEFLFQVVYFPSYLSQHLRIVRLESILPFFFQSSYFKLNR